MKIGLLFLCVMVSLRLVAQELQLHYDPRHGIDPSQNAKNFPTLFFGYFKSGSDDSTFLRLGAFLFKSQCDFLGQNGNVGKFYLQVSQAVKFWNPELYLSFEYSGGLGIAEPGAFGFYLVNAYAAGFSLPLQWEGFVLSTSIVYLLTAYAAPSHDVRYSLYWWKGLWDYKIEFAGDIQFWTQNRNHGDAGTAGLHGKLSASYGEPQLWFNFSKLLSIGTKINLYYHILNSDAKIQAFPTLALRYKLE